MEPPECPAAADLLGNRVLRDRVAGLLRGKAGPEGRVERRVELAMARLDAAQRP